MRIVNITLSPTPSNPSPEVSLSTPVFTTNYGFFNVVIVASSVVFPSLSIPSLVSETSPVCPGELPNTTTEFEINPVLTSAPVIVYFCVSIRCPWI